MSKHPKEINNELRDIGTTTSETTNIRKTRHTDKPVQIDPPIAGTGRVDNRKDTV
jgi:hypothetical protein